ncbi:MAG: hypothetical protein H6581_16795 [Bacteroidia bacterium]|nr:hypothetical protein [Bacteroidia bacterium]
MKYIITVILLLAGTSLSAQKGTRKKIDSLVREINNHIYEVKRDTSRQNIPIIGLNMVTYSNAYFNENLELVKFENKVESTSTLEGDTTELNSLNTFYWHKNQLIKVEDVADKNGKGFTANTWFWKEECIAISPDNPKLRKRTETLPEAAKAIQNKYFTQKL